MTADDDLIPTPAQLEFVIPGHRPDWQELDKYGRLHLYYTRMSYTRMAKLWKKCNPLARGLSLPRTGEHLAVFGGGDESLPRRAGFSIGVDRGNASVLVPPAHWVLFRDQNGTSWISEYWTPEVSEKLGTHPSMYRRYMTESVMGLIWSIHEPSVCKGTPAYPTNSKVILPVIADALEDAGCWGPILPVLRDPASRWDKWGEFALQYLKEAFYVLKSLQK